MTEIERSLAAIVASVRDGVSSAEAVLESSLDAIAERDADIRAWELVDADRALTSARALSSGPAVGPLHGAPVAIKDVIDVVGLPTRCGTALRAAAISAASDAAVVAQLRAQGAVIVGKSVTTEFAYFAPGATRNPVDLARTPGGSSSGSAAAVAAGMVPLAVGTQTAGSTTRPASFCGVAGLALSRGAFSREGVLEFSSTLDVLGFFTPSVGDLALVLDALDVAPAPAATGQVRWSDLTALAVDQGQAIASTMLAALEQTRDCLASSGIECDEMVDVLNLPELLAAQKTVMAFEAAMNLADEVSTGAVSPQLQALLTIGHEIAPAEYEAALALIPHALAQFETQLGDADALLAPATLGPAPLLAEGTTGDPLLSRPWHLLGLPVVTVPGNRSPEGLPLGIQLIGRPSEERRLVEIGSRVERAIASS